jgi:hypothetical protein
LALRNVAPGQIIHLFPATEAEAAAVEKFVKPLADDENVKSIARVYVMPWGPSGPLLIAPRSWNLDIVAYLEISCRYIILSLKILAWVLLME